MNTQEEAVLSSLLFHGIVLWLLLEKGEQQVLVQSELSTRIGARSRLSVLPEPLAPRERQSDFLSIMKPCHCGFFLFITQIC